MQNQRCPKLLGAATGRYKLPKVLGAATGRCKLPKALTSSCARTRRRLRAGWWRPGTRPISSRTAVRVGSAKWSDESCSSTGHVCNPCHWGPSPHTSRANGGRTLRQDRLASLAMGWALRVFRARQGTVQAVNQTPEIRSQLVSRHAWCISAVPSA